MRASDLRRWRADVVSWAEANVWVRSPATGTLGPLVLADHQRAWLTEATRRGPDGRLVHRTCVASWPRREGKSLCVALLLGWRMACFDGQRLLVLANSEKQAASNVFALLTDMFRDSPALRGLVPDEAFLSTKLSVPALDNAAECLPCNWRTVQGRPRTDALACDELHAAENPKAFEFASNQLEGRDAQCLVASQAGLPDDGNPVWRLWLARNESHVHFSYLDHHILPWARALGERERKTLSGPAWRYQHANQWGATGETLWSPNDIDRAALHYVEPRTFAEWLDLKATWGLAEAPCAVGAGLDRAGVGPRGDRSVWATVACFSRVEAEPLYYVLACRVLATGTESEVVQAKRETEAAVGRIDATLAEQYGTDDLLDKIGAAQISPTMNAQIGWFTRLDRALREGRFFFPANAGINPQTGEPGLLRGELLRFTASATPGGGTRFEGRPHDDAVYAVAIALAAVAAAPELPFWQDPRWLEYLRAGGTGERNNHDEQHEAGDGRDRDRAPRRGAGGALLGGGLLRRR